MTAHVFVPSQSNLYLMGSKNIGCLRYGASCGYGIIWMEAGSLESGNIMEVETCTHQDSCI